MDGECESVVVKEALTTSVTVRVVELESDGDRLGEVVEVREMLCESDRVDSHESDDEKDDDTGNESEKLCDVVPEAEGITLIVAVFVEDAEKDDDVE